MSPFRTSADRSVFLDRASASDVLDDISAPSVSVALNLTVPAAHWWQRLHHRKHRDAPLQDAPLLSRDA